MMNILVRCTACGAIWSPARGLIARMCSRCGADPAGLYGKINEIVVIEVHVPTFVTINAKYYKIGPSLTLIEDDFLLLLSSLYDTMRAHRMTVNQPKIVEHPFMPATNSIEATAAIALFRKEVKAEKQNDYWVVNDIAIPYPEGVICLSCGYYVRKSRAFMCPYCKQPLFKVV